MLSRTNGTVWPSLISCSLMIFVLMACTNCTAPPAPSVTKGSPQALSPTASPTARLGAPGCNPPSPIDESNIGSPEAQGTATGTILWALFLGGIPPVKGESKIIWRLGDRFQNPISIAALGPHGLYLLPLFLQEHGGSNWNRPGDEWGSGFTFPETGCWDLHVTGGPAVGDVWVVIS